MNPRIEESVPPLSPEVSKRIGTRLVEQGFLKAPELERAFKVAAERRLDLGAVLVGLGLVTEDQVAAVVAEEFKVPFVFPYANLVDRGLLRQFPAELLQKYRVVPF